MTKGENLLNIEYSNNSIDSIEYDGALLIDRIFNIKENNLEDKLRKDSAIRHVVEAIMWVNMIDSQTSSNNFSMFEIIER